MYVVAQYFLFSTMRSVTICKQQWMMVFDSTLGIGTRLFHVGGTWRFHFSIKIAICDPFLYLFININDFKMLSNPHP
jgi:hypothetical protein